MSDRTEADSHNRRARKLWEQERPEEAILAWEQALSSDPESVEVLANLAWALSQQGQVS